MLRYWFGDGSGDHYNRVWFTAAGPDQDDLDADIDEAFGNLLARAEVSCPFNESLIDFTATTQAGRLRTWSSQPRGLLALIVVTHRGTCH